MKRKIKHQSTVYGIRVAGSPECLYVGCTKYSLRKRMESHLINGSRGYLLGERKTPTSRYKDYVMFQAMIGVIRLEIYAIEAFNGWRGYQLALKRESELIRLMRPALNTCLIANARRKNGPKPHTKRLPIPTDWGTNNRGMYKEHFAAILG